MKVIKVLGAAVGVGAILVIAVLVYLSTLDINEYKALIAQQIEEATGRSVRIKGELELSVSLTPSVVLRGVSFANAGWGTRPTMISARKVQGSVEIIPLLTGEIRVRRLEVVQPEILLETNTQGVGNWVFDERQHTESRGHAPPLAVTTLRVSKAHVEYRDGVTGQSRVFHMERVLFRAADMDSPVSVGISGAIGERNVTVNGTLGEPYALLNNEPLPFALTVTGDRDVELHVNGSVNRLLDMPEAQVSLQIRAGSLAALGMLGGMQLPEVTPLVLEGKLTYRMRHLAVHELSGRVGESDLGGTLEADFSGERPSLTGRFQSNLLALDTLLPTDEKASGRKSDRVFPSEPISAGILNDADVDLVLEAQRMRLWGIFLEQVKLPLTLKTGKLSIQPSAVVGSGPVNGHIQLETGTKAVNFAMSLNGKEVELGALIKQARNKDYLSGGKMRLNMAVKGAGVSPAAIMGSLNGNFEAVVGPGRINETAIDTISADVGMKLFEVLTPSKNRTQPAVLECGVARFQIRRGLARSDKRIAMETNRMTVVGSGTIDLGAETLDLGFKPHVREGMGIGAGSLVGLVRVGGTLRKPEPKVDMESAMVAGATIGAAVMTAGVSILAQSLYEQSSADPHPCATALGSRGASSSRADTGLKGKTEEITESIEKGVKNIGGKLKGLFGK
jgi:AsmA family protein